MAIHIRRRELYSHWAAQQPRGRSWRGRSSRNGCGASVATGADDAVAQTRYAAFLQGLQQSGWEAGRSVRIDVRLAAGSADARADTPQNWSRSRRLFGVERLKGGKAMEPIPLADAIRVLRRELVDAVEKGRDEQLRFRIESIELELQAALTREAGAKGGLKAWVFELGAEGRRETASTQTVTLTLRPHGPNGGDVDVGARRSKDPTRPRRPRS
jgi:hypothetical protein